MYAVNLNDLYSVDELKDFYIEQNTRFPLHTAQRWLVSACISNAPLDVCRESE